MANDKLVVKKYSTSERKWKSVEFDDSLKVDEKINQAIVEVKNYVDSIVSAIGIELIHKHIRLPISASQIIVEINEDDFDPNIYIELIFDNTTKLFKDEYTIIESNESESGYAIQLHNIPTSPKTLELILIKSRLTRIAE